MNNNYFDDIYDEIKYLREKVTDLNNKMFDMRFNIIQLAISLDNWTEEDVKNILGATDEEVKYLI